LSGELPQTPPLLRISDEV